MAKKRKSRKLKRRNPSKRKRAKKAKKRRNPAKKRRNPAKKKKRKKKKSAKRRRAKLKGNYRRPTAAAAKAYVKRYKKMKPETKAKEIVKVRFREAQRIVTAAAKKAGVSYADFLAGKVKVKASKKKGRGSFKFTNATQAKKYLRQVSRSQPLSKLRSAPFKSRIAECILLIGQAEHDAIVATGQAARAAAEKRKVEAKAKKKLARKKGLQTRATRLEKEADAMLAKVTKNKKKWDDKAKKARAKATKARGKAQAARKRNKRKRARKRK